jgi:hypothetical protein
VQDAEVGIGGDVLLVDLSGQAGYGPLQKLAGLGFLGGGEAVFGDSHGHFVGDLLLGPQAVAKLAVFVAKWWVISWAMTRGRNSRKK